MGVSSAPKQTPVPLYGIVVDIQFLLNYIQDVPVLDVAADVLGIKRFIELACIVTGLDLDVEDDGYEYDDDVSENVNEFEPVYEFLETSGFNRLEFNIAYNDFRVMMELDISALFPKEAYEEVCESGFILSRWLPNNHVIFETTTQRYVSSRDVETFKPPRLGGYCRHWPLHRDDEKRAYSAFAPVPF